MIRSIWLGLSICLLTPLCASDAISPNRQQELHNMLIQDCGSCHGLQMRGGLGPPLLAKNLQSKSIEFLASTILYGRPGTAMPPWHGLLSIDEAHWIAARLLDSTSQ